MLSSVLQNDTETTLSLTTGGGQKPYDCAYAPQLCREPFNCQNFTNSEKRSWFLNGVAPDGHANLRSWCAAPDYALYATQCLGTKNLVRAAKVQYAYNAKLKPEALELDASYCFIEGHCSNEAVTNETTLEEAQKMCDDRLGHRSWTKFASVDLLRYAPHLMGPGRMDPKTGYHDKEASRFFVIAACAMGNYHCDVVYCKETYCKMPNYIEKYAHLASKTPGHLIRQHNKPSFIPSATDDPAIAGWEEQKSKL